MSTTVLCPRCGLNEFTPYGTNVDREQLEHAPLPAQSRVAKVYICSPCVVDEALRDWQQLAPIPPDEWPVSSLPAPA